MAKLNLLKDIEVKSAKITNKIYYLNDGGGLRLKVDVNGSKIWEFRFTLNGKSRKTTFKTYPIVSLKEAREKRQEFQELINKNIDPIEYFKNLRNENVLNTEGIFLNVVKEWLAKEEQKTAPSTHINKVRTFDNDIIPFLKSKHIKEIEISWYIILILIIIGVFLFCAYRLSQQRYYQKLKILKKYKSAYLKYPQRK